MDRQILDVSNNYFPLLDSCKRFSLNLNSRRTHFLKGKINMKAWLEHSNDQIVDEQDKCGEDEQKYWQKFCFSFCKVWNITSDGQELGRSDEDIFFLKASQVP